MYGEILAKDHGVSLTHVPYKGEQPAITDVIGGNLDVTFASPVGAKPQVAAGKLKAHRDDRPGSARRRCPTCRPSPSRATRASSCRSGSPRMRRRARRRPIVDRLQKEIAAVIRLPDVLPKMIDQGQTPLGNTPEEFAAAFADDAPKWIELHQGFRRQAGRSR